MKKLLLVLTLLLILVGCACVTKDPHDYVPGWSDNRLEFGQSYKYLVLVPEGGGWLTYTVFLDTEPGWYSIDRPIDYVVMCQ